MRHFFADPAQIREDTVCLRGNDVNHIKNVLRMGVGDCLTVADGQSDCRYLCRITSVGKEEIWAAIEGREEQKTELPSKIFLFQGLPKSDKMEWIIQKAVELGAYEIIPVATRRTVVKLDARKERARLTRWQAIAEGAARQSGRALVPRIRGQMTLEEALLYAGEMEVRLLPYEQAEGMAKTRSILQGVRPGQSIAVFIGPEGGFEEAEVRQARQVGFLPITLGRRILRTETAGLAVLSMLGFLLEA